MKTTTRRAVLAGAAAIPALSLPAEMALADGCTFPALAAEFAEFYPHWAAAILKSYDDQERFNNAMFEETGLTRDQWPGFNTPEYDALVETINRVHDRLPQDPVDEDGCSIIWNELHDQLYPLVDEILAQRAKTIADLGLQVQAIAVRDSESWMGEYHDDEEGKAAIVSLAESIAGLCGVTLLPGLERLIKVA